MSYLFIIIIFGCAESSLLCMGFCWLQRAGVTVCFSVPGSHCGGFSWICRHMGFSSCSTQARYCGSRALLFYGMCNLPGPGLEPMSPASTGRFSSTVPPGKSYLFFFFFLRFFDVDHF